ncbi:hypothetical protein ABMA27_004349 [Loxostege sticticalis]|uniref:MADF domain-containing protein n=1 Tax=Loxostege sticticalis TaxID=481309 RepID=A0ABR3HNB5_LOXSC
MELFIEAVRQYPLLFNSNHKYYRHGDKKDTKLQKITAKSEWKKLRDYLRDSLKRQKCGKTGQAAPAVNNCKYAQIMEFLLPFMKNKKASTLRDSNSDVLFTQQQQQFKQEVEDSMLIPSENKEGQDTQQAQTKTRKRKNDDEIIDLIRDMVENHKIQFQIYFTKKDKKKETIEEENNNKRNIPWNNFSKVWPNQLRLCVCK